MCIAILNTPKGGVIDKVTLNNCWRNNTDGAGMVYHVAGELIVMKEMKNFDRFYANYLKARENHPNSSFVLHFRIGTHGVKGKDNCHPFLVNDNLAFVHNGIISGVPADKKLSDTGMFNKVYLQQLPAGFERNPAIRKLIRAYIGNGNKLVFLGSDGFTHITNEEAGHWNNYNWFSNYTYQAYNTRYVDYGGMTVARTQAGAVKVKGFQANNVYVPANKMKRYEQGQLDIGSKSFNDSSRVVNIPVQCEECETELLDRMEQYYGFCNSCLAKYGMKDETF